MTGVAGGLTGFFEQPISGAQKNGIKGFFKGALTGVTGLVIKPLSGTLDLLSKTSEGVKNLVSTNDREVQRSRLFRPFYGKQQTLKVYDKDHAFLVLHMIRLNHSKYALDHFLDALSFDDLDS